MNYFTAKGVGFVTAFAARITFAICNTVASQSSLHLLAISPAKAWVLALLFVRFYANKLDPAVRKLIETELQLLPVGALLRVLSFYDDEFSPFLRRALLAKDEVDIIGASATLLAAINKMGVVMLHQSLKSSEMITFDVAATEIMPIPPSVAITCWGYFEANRSDRESRIEESNKDEIVAAFLRHVGWTNEENARILAGPKTTKAS